MLFQDRRDAGRKLAEHLSAYANREDVIVLGIPRGGVEVAFEVAQALYVPLDIFVSRKLGVPGHEELAFGAVASRGTRVLDPQTIRALDISEAEVEQITAHARKELERRERSYRGIRPPLALDGVTVLLVDDGIATGSSMLAAIEALQQLRPARIVVAVPVAPMSACDRLKREVDDLVCVYMPDQFYAIGEFYEDFSQVPDERVTRLLATARTTAHGLAEDDPPVAGQNVTVAAAQKMRWVGIRRDVSLDIDGAQLEGTLVLPKKADGLVIFAHGSGSSRHSSRNRYVAQTLNDQGIATLLFDLLTREEESLDRYTGKLRFNVPFLAKRLVNATQGMIESADTSALQMGYFGASTGAAAALFAAANLTDSISVVVSRGGRPDLAEDSLRYVQAATLLIVGGDDEPVISMNRRALRSLGSPEKKLVIVPGATHLFEEPGALEQVAQLASDWFREHFRATRKTDGSSQSR